MYRFREHQTVTTAQKIKLPPRRHGRARSAQHPSAVDARSLKLLDWVGARAISTTIFYRVTPVGQEACLNEAAPSPRYRMTVYRPHLLLRSNFVLFSKKLLVRTSSGFILRRWLETK